MTEWMITGFSSHLVSSSHVLETNLIFHQKQSRHYNHHYLPPQFKMSRFCLQRNYLVTGGTKGIGLAIVRSLLINGTCDNENSSTRVIICARTEQDVNSTSERLNRDFPSRVIGVTCDVSTEKGREKLVAAVIESFGGILHGLVNNVGMNVRSPIGEQTSADYRRMMSTNVDSVYFLCKMLESSLRETAETGCGACVVNVSSMAGLYSSGTGAVYGMTKSAIIQLTKVLACEWSKYNIRVNATAPWMTMTPMLEDAVKNDPTALDKVRQWTPLHRLSTAEEAADPVVFLLMKASSYMTGQCLAIDGGLSAQGFEGPCVAPS